MTAEQLRPLSPLAGRQGGLDALPATVRVRELPFWIQLNLRVDPAGAAAEAVAGVLGLAPPIRACTSSRSADCEVLWLGPDEWLILATPGAGDLESELREAIGGEPAALTDVSAERTILSLTGTGARELLARGCSIDLHPRLHPKGSCVQTLLARAGIIIVVHDDAASDFLLLVRASFAEYLTAWLIDASAEIH